MLFLQVYMRISQLWFGKRYEERSSVQKKNRHALVFHYAAAHVRLRNHRTVRIRTRGARLRVYHNWNAGSSSNRNCYVRLTRHSCIVTVDEARFKKKNGRELKLFDNRLFINRRCDPWTVYRQSVVERRHQYRSCSVGLYSLRHKYKTNRLLTVASLCLCFIVLLLGEGGATANCVDP